MEVFKRFGASMGLSANTPDCQYLKVKLFFVAGLKLFIVIMTVTG
jgi:hypothetical protein